MVNMYLCTIFGDLNKKLTLFYTVKNINVCNLEEVFS